MTVEDNGMREAVIRTIAMPSDTNPAGDIFGGWLMSQMDLAAGNAAARRARGRCVTVAVDGMVFHTPVHVGDEVSVYADLISWRFPIVCSRCRRRACEASSFLSRSSRSRICRCSSHCWRYRLRSTIER